MPTTPNPSLSRSSSERSRRSNRVGRNCCRDGGGPGDVGGGASPGGGVAGKAVPIVSAAAAAATAGIPVVTVSGRLMLAQEQLRAAGIRQAYALTEVESDVRRCIADAGPLLEVLAGRLARDWLVEQERSQLLTDLRKDR